MEKDEIPFSKEGSTQAVSHDDLRQETRSIREDFLVIFGIFASLFIFLSVEIQIFRQATSFSLLIGFSLFLLAAILSFILCLFFVVKDKNKFSDYNHPIVYFILALFVAAGLCFAWEMHNASRDGAAPHHHEVQVPPSS